MRTPTPPSEINTALPDVEVGAVYAALVESAEDAIFIKRLDGTIMSWNPGAERLYGYSPEEILGRSVTVLAPRHLSDEIPSILARLAAGERIEHFETVRSHQDGSRRDVALTISPIRNRNGEIVAASTVARDITARKAAERQVVQELAHSAEHDYLTGLPNRMLLDDRIKQAIKAAPRHSGQVAVLYLDLDGFKVINDGLGHPLGDQLLQAVAAGLLSCVRVSDTVSRQGGDEFVVLLAESQPSTGPSMVAQRMLDAVSAITDMDGHSVEVSTSIGIALYPADGHDADSLIKNADIAMYQVKGNGRSGYKLYDDSMPSHARSRPT